MRKIVIALILVLGFIGLGLFAYFCLFSSTATGEGDIIVVDYWTHEDAARSELEDRLISEFEAQNPNIRINRQILSSSEILNIIPTSFEAGKAPDLFTLQQDYLSQLLYRGYLAPVDLTALGYEDKTSLEADYLDGALSSMEKDDEIHGIPMELTNWCLYINKRLFKESGLDADKDYPRTWEDIVSVCEKLVKREDGIITTRGFDFRYPQYLTFFVSMVEQLGGAITDSTGTLSVVNEEAWERAFAFMQAWGPNGRNLGSPTYKNARSIFNQENIAMMLSGLYQEERIERENPEFYYSDDWLIVPFPTFEGGKDIACSKYCHYWCVNSDSDKEKQVAAWKFAGFLSSHANDYLEEVRLLLPKKSVIYDLTTTDIPYIEVFISDLGKSGYVYSGPDTIKISDILENLMKEVMLSALEPQKAVIRLKVSLAELHL